MCEELMQISDFMASAALVVSCIGIILAVRMDRRSRFMQLRERKHAVLERLDLLKTIYDLQSRQAVALANALGEHDHSKVVMEKLRRDYFHTKSLVEELEEAMADIEHMSERATTHKELLAMEKAVATFGRRVKHAEGFLREGHELLSKLRAANSALVVDGV